MDIKGQVHRGGAPGKWDQRKSTDSFQGAEDNFNVATAVEFRAEGDLAEMLTDPDRINEFIQPGDNILQVVNRVFTKATEHQHEIFGEIAGLLHLGGEGRVEFGFLAYDND